MSEKIICHEGNVYLPKEIYTETIMFWYDKTKPSVVIYSDTDFIIPFDDAVELTYTLQEIKYLNVRDFVIGPIPDTERK